ncbi:histidine--tRNA ligase [Candidatus Woesebacteria bacterium RIFCSPHIGHO2_01_FULL_44_21]|uniref:Histidine--tRNA ligase n=1 Tax=Candidatus Woesebacteria bacterium RIFCSPHIGHO2_01_FULL_44_21 TaxID=1802503 RepID=A0A1F7Z0U3_9BACT|nr:MAG: histidine--tRNA ligase [Candidatus Woesebacteria bacterium RIFCSPHIGHO2_01_FULL_44_21]OGM69474.1 MAG: histidine--tRNA ligase [Candidatus Woesebacteria bacterium RIFCSPLOWO2_01_FULL_44_24b]
MTKQNIQLLKGFRDFLPEEARKRAWLRTKMVSVFEKWGYEPLETPTLEPLELFAGQIGEDEKLFFKFKDQGDRDVALRYDQTVPSVRVVGQNLNNIVFPFRRYQIQSAFRSEKPQKGRYREFVQADIDIFGIESPIADAECIAVSIDLYKTLGFKDVVALINSRELLKEIPYPVIAAIDKIKKIGAEGVVSEIIAKGFTQKEAEDFLEKVNNLKPDKTLETIFSYLKNSGIAQENYKFEPTLARSFSYSEGPIWEMVIPGYSTASFGGSVGGGERYDGMFERIIGKKIAGTGIAFGFDRTLEALETLNLLPKFGTNTRVLVTVFSDEFLDRSIEVSTSLRDAGINTELYPDNDTQIGKQIKYADKKGIPYVVIIGEEEVKQNKVTLKEMASGENKLVALEEVVQFIDQKPHNNFQT